MEQARDAAQAAGEPGGAAACDLAGAGGELPIPAALVAALAVRLLHDPEFHDEVLEWFEAHLDDEAAGEDDDEDAAGEG